MLFVVETCWKQIKNPSISTVTINMSKEVMSEKLKSSCRICLNDHRLPQVPLNKNTSQTTDLTNAEILYSFTNVLVDPSDGLPAMICAKCENMLHSMVIFKNECLESNETLRAFFDAFNLEEEEEDFTEKTEPELEEGNTSNESLEVDLESILCKAEPAIQEVVVDDAIQNNVKEIVENDVNNIQHTMNPTDEYDCPKSEKTPPKLMLHMPAHTSEIFTCDICHYRSMFKLCIRRHMVVHTIQRELLECDECGLKYKNKDNLKKHQKKIRGCRYDGAR